METDALIDRAGDLKQQLVAYSQQPRYERALREFFAEHEDAAASGDEDRLILLWDAFVLEHRLRNGRTVVEQFVDAHPELPPHEREMLLGWRDVVTGPFEVQRREADALILTNLVDELTYRARSTVGPSVFGQMPRGAFLLTRLVAVGEDWTFSGPTSVLRPEEHEAAFQMALDVSLRTPEAAYRNPEKLAQGWELQRAERQRFIRFFGSDLAILPGEKAQRRLNDFHAYSREETLSSVPETTRPVTSDIPVVELPPDFVESETVAFIYDEDDGLGFYANFGRVQEAFSDPDLLQDRAYRDQVRTYLDDESIEPMVLRRLAEQDPDQASRVFRRLLDRPDFDWTDDGEDLLRSAKPDYFARPARPHVTPLSDRLAAYAARR